MESAAQGVDPEDRDQTGLMGVKPTNSPDRVELPPTPPRSRCRDRRSYSPITSSRWQQQSIPIYPCVGTGDISFVSNDALRDGLVIATLIWLQDHLMMYFLETSWSGSLCMQGTRLQ